ncbi:MAG: hypothetical protein AAF514_19985, partial [Verrucomicrobiota bacterium]
EGSKNAIGEVREPVPAIAQTGEKAVAPLPSQVYVSGLVFEIPAGSLVATRFNHWNTGVPGEHPGRLTEKHFRRLQSLLGASNGVRIIGTPRFAVEVGKEGSVENLRDLTFPTAYQILEGTDSHHPKTFGSTSFGFTFSVRPEIMLESGGCRLELVLENKRFNGFQDLGQGMRVPVFQRLKIDTTVEAAWGEVLFFGGNQELARLKASVPEGKSPLDQGLIKTWRTGETIEWRTDEEVPPSLLFFLLQVRPVPDLPKARKA